MIKELERNTEFEEVGVLGELHMEADNLSPKLAEQFKSYLVWLLDSQGSS